MEVTFHLLGNLAFSYESKLQDLQDTWLPTDPPVRQIVRQVDQVFWLYRELLAYGSDCVCISPASVVSNLKEQIRRSFQHYFADPA